MRVAPIVALKMVALVTVVTLAGSSSAWAGSIGVGTDTGKIKVDQKLAAGGTYRLPEFRVGNTGTASMGYVLRAVPYQDEKPIPSSWVSLQPDAVFLFPKQWVAVNAKLDIPSDAAPGHYVALLVATPKMPGSKGTTKVNIGAGPRVEIDVVAGNPFKAMVWDLRRRFAQLMPWSAAGSVVLGVGVLGLLVALGVRRSRRRRRIATTTEPEPAEST